MYVCMYVCMRMRMILTPYYTALYIHEDYLFDEHGIDYIVHGDDPCIVNGKDVYMAARERGKCMCVCVYVCVFVYLF